MSNKSNVIGEGSYGCVHKPSLECEQNGIDYNNKISKIMNNKDLIKELNEYEIIKRADPTNEFFLGIPKQCKPKQSQSNIESIKDCNIRENVLQPNLQQIKPDYSLLIMEDGGINLCDFAQQMGEQRPSPENQKIMEDFWIECHRLYVGLSVLLKNDIIHRDMKGENIVYNPIKNRVAFIDFGLVGKLSILKHHIKYLDYEMPIHWSYPIETVFYKFSRFTSKALKDELLKNIDKAKENYLRDVFPSIRPEVYLNYILPKGNIDDELITRDQITTTLFHSTKVMIEQLYINYSNDIKIQYDDFLDKSLQTFDLYGMSMGLMYVFVRTFHLIKNSRINYEELFLLLFNGIRLDQGSRYTVELSLNKYEEILQDILLTNNKEFVNHVITEIQLPSPPISAPPEISDKELDKLIEETEFQMDELFISPNDDFRFNHKRSLDDPLDDSQMEQPIQKSRNSGGKKRFLLNNQNVKSKRNKRKYRKTKKARK